MSEYICPTCKMPATEPHAHESMRANVSRVSNLDRVKLSYFPEGVLIEAKPPTCSECGVPFMRDHTVCFSEACVLARARAAEESAECQLCEQEQEQEPGTFTPHEHAAGEPPPSDVNPFDLLTPTRNNFATLAEAIAYYEVRRDACKRAVATFTRGFELVQSLVENTEAAAAELSKLTAEEVAAYGLPEKMLPSNLREYADSVTPLLFTFADSSRRYDERGTLLERTLEALRAELQRQSDRAGVLSGGS